MLVRFLIVIRVVIVNLNEFRVNSNLTSAFVNKVRELVEIFAPL